MTLAEYLPDAGDCAALARKMNLPHSTIWRWRAGKRRPTIEYALRLERATKGKVPLSSWFPRSRSAA